MYNAEDKILTTFNQILVYLNEGKMDPAMDLLVLAEPDLIQTSSGKEFSVNLRKFIKHNQDGAVFINAVANGNLDVNPPDDPLRQNYVIAQYKQLHSNLHHLTWQAQQIAKGDLKQKVSFLGEFSSAFNKLIESLRDKKVMEDKIKLQFEQLQKLNAEKDKFFSIIAHDLRSPFNGFLGLTQLMAEDIHQMTLNDIQEIAVNMKDSAANLFRLLENLLEWSRMEQGLIPFNPTVLKLDTVVDESTKSLLEPARTKGIKIKSNIPDNVEVFADSKILQTVVRNLASNAVKFTGNGGEILISAEWFDERFIRISIIDSGIGMNNEMVENLFRIGARTGRVGTDGELSTGLGLILCKEFVEKHDGKIWAESEEGKGSVFYFTVPFSAH